MKFQARFATESIGDPGFQIEWATEFEAVSMLEAMEIATSRLKVRGEVDRLPPFSQFVITAIEEEK